MAEDRAYMANPLVVWVETFRDNDSPPLKYKDLYDGVFLCDVMQRIDPRPAYQNLHRVVDDDASIRQLNWDLLIKNIRAYYLEVLQQLLILKLPNIHAICRDPHKDSSFEEIRKVLLLVLGCAVQCEHKQSFIENIKQLEIEVQHAIVEHIKEITDDSEAVLPIEPPAELEAYTEKMFAHLTRLIKERDDVSELMTDLSQERDFYQSQAEGAAAPIIPTVTPEKHHLAVELAESKAKLRRTRQELEEKQEQLSDIKDELEDTKASMAKLRNENLDLTQDARATRALRDELDIIKEKASKVDTYEKEISKYKERLNELEFYRARMEELREENNILEETKTVLEDQLASSHKRVETVRELENELLKFRELTQEMTAERDGDREKIQQLTEDILRLEMDKRNSMNESANLEQELQDARHKPGVVSGSLSDQLSETSNARILRLQLENQQLHEKLQEASENALIQNTAINLENEKEIQRLSKKLEKLQESNSLASQECLDMEEQKDELSREKEKLIVTLEMVKENSDRQVRELEAENEHLTQTIDVLRERNEKSNDARIKDLERENRRLHETVSTKNAMLSKLEFETKQLHRSYQKLKENVDTVPELENENAKLEKENSEMHKQITTLELTCDKLSTVEQEISDLDVENRKLTKTVDTLQNSLRKKEQLEEQNINLTVENQKLQRMLDSLRDSSEKNFQLENDKDVLNREIQQLKKSLESQKQHKAKQEQMEFELLDIDNENQRLQKSLDITTRRMEQLENDNSDLENENEKLAKTLESMKVSIKRLEEKEKEALETETELSELQKERATLEKENKKLRQSLELRDSSYEELTARNTAMEQQHKSLKKSVEKLKETCARVRDLEKENKELMQEVHLDKKTIPTLREDLVNEKIKSTTLCNELETLKHELERVGINREKLVMAEQMQDDSRYQALESMMEDAFKKSLDLKEQKIQLLESRLEESKSWNQRLNEELREARREAEMLKQRYEEEENFRESDRKNESVRSEHHHHHHATQDILDLKDHLVQVERTNATLMSENSNLKSQNTVLNDQLHKLDDQNLNLQSRTSSLQEQFVTLQSQNAKLQVETTTLQSKCSSLFSHNNALQSQMSTLESEHELLIQNHEDLQTSHESFVSDHEALQQLHEQLTTDYESLISEHGSLKSIHKSLKNELKDLQEQLDSLLQGKDDVNKLRDILEREREQLKSELRALGNLQMDYDKLRDEHDRLRSGYDKLSQEYRGVLTDHKQLKKDNHTLNLKNTEMTGEVREYKDTITNMDIEMQKLENRFDALYQVNQKLDEENRALLYQVQQLLNQNQDLLTQALNSKDQQQEEQKSYIEKLADLRRQKERLEEKIMEHYKNRWDSPKKNKGFGAMIARKAKGIISRRQRSKSRPNLASESPENSTIGSVSHGESGDQINDSRKSDKRTRRCSEGSALLATPKLAKQNKSLAKSTTALNFTQSPKDRPKLRGAKSSEDIVGDLSHNGSGEKDSMSSGNSTQLLPGLGRQYQAADEEAGFMPLSPKSPVARRPGSPGSEMLTLEQFLNEANKQSPPKKPADRRSQDDAESRSTGSASSDPTNRVIMRKPSSVSQQQDMSHRYSSHSSHIPDVAASAQPNTDLNMSILSRISGGSANIPETSPPPNNRPDLKTSTPKANTELYGPRAYSYERSKSLESTKWQNMQNSSQRLPPEDVRSPPHTYATPQRLDDYRAPQGAETSLLNSSTMSYQYGQPIPQMSSPEPVRSPPPPPGARPSQRELPPTPVERVNLAPAERLDRLTMMGSASSSTDQASLPGHYSNRQSLMADGRGYDRESSSGHLSREPRPQPQGGIRGQSPAAPRNYRSRSPGASSNHYATPSRPSLPSTSSTSSQERGQGDRPPPYGRPTGAAAQFQHRTHNHMVPNNRPSTSRPASVMGHPAFQISSQSSSRNDPIYSTVEKVRSSRPTTLEGGSGTKPHSTAPQTNGPYTQNSYTSRSQTVERPKSVPPHLFNQNLNNDYQSSSQRRGNVPPVPPPRRSREPGPLSQPGNTVSLLREPGSLGSRPSTDGSNVPGPQQPSSNQMGLSATARLLPNTARHQTPTARIQPQTKTSFNKAAQSVRPVKPEDQPQQRPDQGQGQGQGQAQGQGQGPNKSSVWHRR
ncbi:girdin-like isoform X2 [Haliotis rufescens]|uniref:girdin-like isoform X2 n=1 Tax=Haliotis rufescens TaxID=6454 RepID=UPI001EAFCBB9|nr:girdin-like isoform X2 [Haliotis rufescens]